MEPEEYDRVFRHETTHFWYRGLHERVVRTLRRAIGSLEAPRILDAGSGTGGLLEVLAARLPKARTTGVEISERALALATSRKPARARFVRADVARLPFASGAFDAAVSLDVLYHRAVGDDRAALAEIARVVRTGGSVVVNLPAHPSLAGSHDQTIHGARRYTRSGVLALARAAGLEPVRVSWFNSFLFPPIALVRLLHRNAPARSDVAALPAPVNAALTALLSFEARLADVMPLPFGLSVFAVLKKP